MNDFQLPPQKAGGPLQRALAVVGARVGAAHGAQHGLARRRARAHRAAALHAALRTVAALHLRARIDTWKLFLLFLYIYLFIIYIVIDIFFLWKRTTQTSVRVT